MSRFSSPIPSVLAAVALASAAQAQFVVTYNATTDTLVAFSPVDGSLISANFMPVAATVQVGAIDVNGEIWSSEQTGDRVVRYDSSGNVLGVIGPTFPGGGFDNIRGLQLINGTVYVTNDGTANGATADSLVLLDTAGNHLSTVALTNSVSPFCVIPFQGDLLVSGSSNSQDIFRYTLAGAPVGTFHDSASLNFANQISLASDGNVWVNCLTSTSVVKLDATTGAPLLSFTAGSGRGVYELQNGNVLWTSSNGASVYNMSTATSTQVLAGGMYQLNLVLGQHSSNVKYGTGCHSYVQDDSNLFSFFTDVASAKTALDGNALAFTKTANGYVANWQAGAAAALYVPPSAGAVIIANADNTTTAITPSAPIPVPGGTEGTWTVSSNGILTAGNPGNQTTSSTPTLAATATQTRLAFYTWCNHNPAETSSGKVKWEEAGGLLLVTFEGVEFSGGTPTLAPSTFQFQIDMTTGDVKMLWTSFSATNSTSDVLVGCTLAGAGLTPVSQSLTQVGYVLEPDATLVPMTLSATPPPVINPSTVVTYTIGNIPEIAPSAGLYLSFLVLSVNPLVAGLDLQGILTTVPGCRLHVGSLDLIVGVAVTPTPTNAVPFVFSAPPFAPGNVIAAQGVALFNGTFPLINGESGGYLLSNAVLSTTRVQ